MNPSDLERLIVTIRDQKVILDHDLASIYGVPTYRFNEAFKRNRRRFPADFAFQLTAQEFTALRAGNAAAQSQPPELKGNTTISSQIAMRSGKKRGAAYRPWAFTEHGALQAANILRSEHAVQMSVFVIRAFLKMREALLGTRELAKKLAELEAQLAGRLDVHEAAIVHVLQEFMRVLKPAPTPPILPKKRIGFHL